VSDSAPHIAITGGPGGGKTALLEIVRRHLCDHVTVLPESAGIIYGGGFPRRASPPARRAAQRAIYHVQRELEQLTDDEQIARLVLCDRGTLDGLAYWPGSADEYFHDLNTTLQAELARYAAVIHLRTPAAPRYNNHNPLRTENAAEAARLDERILEVWRWHPNVHVIEDTPKFLDKVERALALLRPYEPTCCHEARAAG
jgi:predicted ATPase